MSRSPFLVVTLLSTLLAGAGRAEDPTLPAEDQRPIASRAQAVDAFVKDCRATLTAVAWIEGEETSLPECKALDVEQNCNPDVFGCATQFDGCQHKCQTPCGNCQDRCADTCDSCKSSCAAGDKACVRKCAEARADCRGGCMQALRQCQGPACAQAMNECSRAAAQKVDACDKTRCVAYHECIMEQDDYDKAQKACAPKGAGLDAFCRDVCGGYGEMVFEAIGWDSGASSAEPDAKALAAACTAEASCPKDYAALVPYLDGFCKAGLDDASLASLQKDVDKKRIDKRTLSLVFNAYGAMHGYQFKKETWMNGFFYGAGGAWLPTACKARMKSAASPKDMPLRLTKLRDRVKKIWNALP